MQLYKAYTLQMRLRQTGYTASKNSPLSTAQLRLHERHRQCMSTFRTCSLIGLATCSYVSRRGCHQKLMKATTSTGQPGTGAARAWYGRCTGHRKLNTVKTDRRARPRSRKRGACGSGNGLSAAAPFACLGTTSESENAILEHIYVGLRLITKINVQSEILQFKSEREK
jgi:hypothetical protein